jgi:ABC-type multidrug transport system fused ATPase/permease subunit
LLLPFRLLVFFSVILLLCQLGILRNVLWNMPLYLSVYLDAGVAAKRIRTFLEAPEVELFPPAVTVPAATQAGVALERVRIDTVADTLFSAISTDRSLPLGTIRLENAHFTWGSPSSDAGGFALSNLSFECKPGQLTAVVGSVGSGKSSLVLAVLGEMAAATTASYCKLNGRVAYVPQSAFILNATCKENILFGACFDRERYEACPGLSVVFLCEGSDP